MGDNGSGLSRRGYLRGIGTVGAAAASGLSGCSALPGAGDEGSSSYTIAVTVPKSGQYSDVGDAMERGYEYGASSENATANVAEFIEEEGGEFNLVVRDDESDPDTVSEQLEDIASEYEVNMVWGSYGNELSEAAASFAEDNEVPFIGPFFPHEAPHEENSYEWTYPTSLKSSAIASSTAANLDAIPDEGRPSQVGIWEPSSDWGAEMADRWEAALDEADEDYEVVLREQFDAGSEDFGDLVSQSMEDGVEVVLSNPTQDGGVAAIEAMKAEGFAPSAIVFPRAADRPGWWDQLGTDGEYVQATPGWVPGITTSGNTNLWSSYKEEYDLGDSDMIPTAAGSAFSVAQLVMRAFQQNDPYDGEEVRESLRENEFDTVIGQLEFEDNGLLIDDEGFEAPIGQWYDGDDFEPAPRRVYPRGDSFYGLEFQHPFPSWDER